MRVNIGNIKVLPMYVLMYVIIVFIGTERTLKKPIFFKYEF